MIVTPSHAQQCRRYLRSKYPVSVVEEYIAEAEHQDGEEYWNYFDPDPTQGDFRDELDEDFQAYLDLMGDEDA